MKARVTNPTKLTLRLDKSVIERGKTYARRNGTSLSRMFEEFIREKVKPEYEPVKIIEIHPNVLAMMGKPLKAPLPSYDEIYADYADHVGNKHLRSEEE